MADIFSRSNKPLKGTNFVSPGRTTNPFGVFVGFVKDNTDVQRMGRLRVWIPEFGSLPTDSDGWITVNYCSPFAGATNPDTEDKNNVQSFEGTQTSYGMWMIPPDLENQVLIMFINGDTAKGIWIGSLFQQFMNQMIPATAASSNNYQYGKNNADTGHSVPVAEYNKWNTVIDDPQNVRRPYSKTRFRGLGNQGLISDPVRGISTTSARREAPSQVYGILTPGPLQEGTTTARRTGGSSFVMDDGIGSEYVQLSTKSGAQIKIDETNGFIFLINRDGTSWIQMDRDGNIDIFGAGNASIRAQKDINFRADRNINIEAGQNIYLKSAKDTKETTTVFTYNVNGIPQIKTIPFWEYVGEGKGDGGNIVMQALNNLQSTIQNNAFLTVKEGNLNVLINNALTVTTDVGGMDFNANKGIKLTTGAAVDISATGKVRVGSQSNIDLSAQGTLTACSQGKLSLNSDADIIAKGGSSIKLGSSTIVINSGNTSIGGGTVNLAPPGMPSAGTPSTPDAAQSAIQSPPAEVKPLNDKINILPDWKVTLIYPEWVSSASYRIGDVVQYSGQTYEAVRPVTALNNKNPPNVSTIWIIFVPEDKFVRNAESFSTTISRLPTFEPCPENAGFKLSAVNGYSPPVTDADTKYQGSGSNPDAQSPSDSTNSFANNIDVMGDDIYSSLIGGNMDLKILKSQLAINEGIEYHSYLDTVGLPTAGIGHLLSNPTEIKRYPVGTVVSKEQVDQWFVSDISVAVRGAQRVLGNTCWDALSDVRQRAVADLTYNLGEAKLLQFKKFISALKVADYTSAGQELTSSIWFKQVGVRGPRIVQMISTGIDPLDWVVAAKNIV